MYDEYFNLESTKEVRRKLVQLLEKRVEDNYTKHDKEVRYQDPSWAEYQADAIGERRTLRSLIQLLK